MDKAPTKAFQIMEMFTRDEAAKMLRVTPRTIINWEKKGWIVPALFVGNRPRYTVKSLQGATSKTKVTQSQIIN